MSVVRCPLSVVVGLLAVVLATDIGQPTTDRGVDFPAKQWPNMVARLHVQVADEPDAAGFARVRLAVDVEGPATLEVEPPHLDDAIDAWKVRRASSWRIDEGKAQWEDSFDLRQVKPGLAPIPSVKLRCRESPTAPWEEAEWTNILTDLHGLPLPGAPPVASFSWWWLVVAAVPGVAVLICGVVWWRRARRQPPPALTAEERALAALQRLEATLHTAAPQELCNALSTGLRRYVAERFAVPALGQTTPEFLTSLSGCKALAAIQRDQLGALLERCDLVKFAGVSPTLEESREMVQFVAAFVRACGESSHVKETKGSETEPAPQRG
jgi:hypothetical protein